jgi:Ca2+-binding EF-hand superfamily protein
MKATTADHVTRKQFRQALSTAGIELPADQMELIYEKFDDSNDLSINYVAFTRAVDPTVRAPRRAASCCCARL